MTSNTDDLYNEIMKNKPNEVRLVLSKIDEILAKDLKNEDYEDCARLRDMKEPLNKFLTKMKKALDWFYGAIKIETLQ